MSTVDLAESAGPAPDRTAAVEVHLHPQAARLAPSLVESLKALCGDRLHVLDGVSSDAAFPFDRAPLPIHSAHGPALVSFLSGTPSSLEPYPEVASWCGRPHEEVPLLLDRGALICAAERVLVSEVVLERNQRAPDGCDVEGLRARGWRPRSSEVVRALLAEGLNRPRRDFHFVPTMPGDADAHAASWLLALDGKLVVPEIEQAAFDAIGLAHELALGRLVQTFLDVQAAALEAKGFGVERLPMMPPTNLVRAQHRDESWIGRCSSPTGGVLLELCGQRKALLPRPSAEGFPVRYRAALGHALEVWRARFEQSGYEVLFIEDAPLIERGGSLRQLVASFPAP